MVFCKKSHCYNNFVYNEKQKTLPDPSKLTLWNDRLFSLRRSYDSLISFYQTNFPDYFSLKYNYSIVPLDSIALHLPPDQVILEYHVTDSNLFCFFIGNESFYLKDLGKIETLYKKLDTMRAFFSGGEQENQTPEQFQEFIITSNELYEILISPFKEDILDKRLLIIPDGELGFLAFDILLSDTLGTQSFNFKDLPWLIKTNAVSYNSSANIFYEQELLVQKKAPSGKILAFAPSYDYISSSRALEPTDTALLKLLPLTGTREEVKGISRSFNTKTLFDRKATETNFKELSPGYGILHLAMHTLINNEKPLYSKLVFSSPGKDAQDDGMLNTFELFNLRLSGELAVLSACNTGVGKLEKGEGIISLARGFFYAGIPSVIMTLWEIEDYSSADLMAIFYQNLKLGMPTDVALQQAKLAYLASADQLHGHPYYWAGFVNIGKTRPIHVQQDATTWKWVIYVLALTAILVIIFLFINKRVYLLKKRH